MAEVLTSPASKRNAEMTTHVVEQQQAMMRVLLVGGKKEKLTWLYEAPGVTTKLASDLMKALLSGDNENEDETFQLGEKVTNEHYDRFVVAARDAQVAECPAAVTAARKWAAKWVKVLEEQASVQGEAIQKLMSAAISGQPRKLWEVGLLAIDSVIATFY